jgi:hypothetical protein
MESAASTSTAKNSFTADLGPNKKKLTDVKVNPKIAASLGLKPVVAAPPKSSSAAAVNPNEIDLLGGLNDEVPAAPGVVDTGVSDNGGWDAFGDSDSAPAASALPSTTTSAAVVDPFALPAPAAASSSPRQPAVPTRTALPEDAFSDLTGLNKPLQPMGVAKKSPGVSPTAGGGGGGSASQSPSGGGGGGGDPFGGFADFSAAPTTTATTANVANDPFADLLS